MVDPVAHFSPAPGLIVDRTADTVSISGNMELYGDEATAVRAIQIQQSINRMWTVQFSDGVQFTCTVLVMYRSPGTSEGRATQIEAKIMSGPSHVSDYPGMARCMTLNASEQDAFTWTPAHEFGHILGMKDRYSESIASTVRGTWGGRRECPPDKGYDGNLMGVDQGKMQRQNLSDFESENQPSPYWVNDDDQVRDWVNCHSLTEIRALSTNNKLAAINRLMTGWISDDDMAAMGKICASVTNPAESKAIRQGVDLLTFSSIGQRTQMRVFLAKMP